MTSCLEARELFSPYIDFELAESEVVLVESHLDQCPDCRLALGEEQAMRELARKALCSVSFPKELTECVRESIRRADKQEGGSLAALFGGWFWPGFATAGASAALVLFAIRFVGFPQADAPEQKEVTSFADNDGVDTLAAIPTTSVRPVSEPSLENWISDNFDANAPAPDFYAASPALVGADVRQFRGRRVLTMEYALPEGVFTVQVHQNTSAKLPQARRFELNGRAVWVGRLEGYPAVSLQDFDNRAYVFHSSQLSRTELVHLVEQSNLVGASPFCQ